MGVPFRGRGSAEQGASDPATFVLSVTPSVTPLTEGPCRAVLVETAGRLNVTLIDGTVVSNVPFVAGFNPICASALAAPTSGTAATGVFALY